MSASKPITSLDPNASTVAIIEPDEITRDSLVFLLESVELNVALYPSAERFLAQIEKTKFSCLITEVVLPGINGIALIEKLSQLKQLIPAIILTEDNDVAVAVHAIHAGAADFIEKPFVEPMLLQRIMQILEQNCATKNGN